MVGEIIQPHGFMLLGKMSSMNDTRVWITGCTRRFGAPRDREMGLHGSTEEVAPEV